MIISYFLWCFLRLKQSQQKVQRREYVLCFYTAVVSITVNLLQQTSQLQIIKQQKLMDDVNFDSDDQPNYEQQYEIQLKTENSIQIAIINRQTVGNTLKKHTVYHIKGEDKYGSFQVSRRYNQFFKMRLTMVKKWPGCLIPSIPTKNPIKKNQQSFNRKRERYLNDFLVKTSHLPHLYYSQEFQLLLRSSDKDLGEIYDKWPATSTEDIINRYKEHFYELEGKEVNEKTMDNILSFYQLLMDNYALLQGYRKKAKDLAKSRDKLNKLYESFFKNMQQYEENHLGQYIGSNSSNYVYLNPSFKSLQSHKTQFSNLSKVNPYWFMYDLIKHEERDTRAFSELLKSIQYYGQKTKSYQDKIQSNVKGIGAVSQGKINFKLILMKGTNDEIKYQLEVQNEGLKKNRQYSMIMKDVVIAIVAHIEIGRYKAAKKKFYKNVLQKIYEKEATVVYEMHDMWKELAQKLETVGAQFQL